MPSGVLGGKNSKLKAGGCFLCDSMSALVSEVGSEPALGLLQRERLAAGVVGGLILADLVDGKIARLRVGEVEAADARRGEHSVALGELHAGLRSFEQAEQGALLGVVRTRRIAGRGPDAAVLFGEEIVVRELLLRRVAPVFLAHALVQQLGEGLG